MINAIMNNKDRWEDGGSINTNEDARTAMTFGRLLYLPQELFWFLLSRAALSSLPKTPGKILSVDFWPKWKCSKENYNTNYVEPDIFIQFENLNLIIEAKKNDVGGNRQSEGQWTEEINAYLNEYAEQEADKPLCLLAIGGNDNLFPCSLTIQQKTFEIYKCSWINLLHTLDDYKEQSTLAFGRTNSDEAILRILDDVISVFHLYGDHVLSYLRELADFDYSFDNNTLNNIQLWTIKE